MKLTELVAEPKLVKVVISDAGIVEKYGNTVDFWTYDRINMNTFMKFAQLGDVQGSSDIGSMMDLISDLILDENGNKMLVGNKTLPLDIQVAAANALTEFMGKMTA
jgi:hypothetical protein